jgi:hypothetical protein
VFLEGGITSCLPVIRPEPTPSAEMNFRQADYSLLKPVWSGLVSIFNEPHEKMSQ